MKPWIFAGTALICSLLSGCRDSAADAVTATRAQNGQTVSLSAGNALIVELPGNPTTGYEWTVTHNDASLLLPEEPGYDPDSSAIGAGGTYTFRFQALKAGAALLRMAYRRAWEPAPLETFSLAVDIQDP